MAVPFLDLKKQITPIKEEIMNNINSVIDSSSFILGNEVKEFEEQIAKYLSVKHAISCASGSDALLLSLMASGVEPGDEVITTPFTFFATAGSIARLGAKPVFVDIDKDTYNINPDLIEEKITKNTKAIMPVHIFGQSCDMTAILKIAKKHNLKIIEDACQAIGSEYQGKKVGTIGDFGCFSFFPTKNLGGMGDGGLVVTNDDNLADFLKKARVHGSKKKYHHEFVGFNSRLDAIQAAVLRVKLKYLDEWNNKRIKIAKEYTNKLKDKFKTPFETENIKHIYHQYALLAKNEKERDEIIQKLKNKNISCGIYYPIPLHLQECFKYLGYQEGDLPISEKTSRTVFSIPIYPDVDYKQVLEGFE
ncbi:MAG: DegT/DnrJ/EryC1/StrS family aminotransferase [Nanobdellota archaeon]